MKQLMVLIVAVALPLSVLAQPLPERDIDRSIVGAWKRASATERWYAQHDFGFGGSFEKKGKDRPYLPGFLSSGFGKGELWELPDPGVPFALDLSGPEEQLKALGRFSATLEVLRLGNSCQVTDVGVKELTGLNNLRVLSLGGSKVTDVGMKDVGTMKSLRTLSLNSTKVTDAGLKELAELKGLERLFVVSCDVTDAGLTALSGMTNLESLDISGTKITDGGLKSLAMFKKLKALKLRQQGPRNKVTDDGLKDLTKLTGLQLLDLRGANVTDKGLKELAKMTSLESLDLIFTRVTDRGLMELSSLKNLRTLYVIRPEKGLSELRKALPNLKIVDSLQ